MFTKKTDFKSMKADQIIASYKRNVLIFWILHVLSVPALGMLAYMALAGRMTLINAAFSGVVVCLFNYLLYAGRAMQYHALTRVLTNCCDPVKGEKVFGALAEGNIRKKESLLHKARCQFYRGDWEGALTALRAIERPKEKSPLVFQYYNLMAACYDELDCPEQVTQVREKVKGVLNGMKEKSPQVRNGRQLLGVIDGILTFHRGSYTRSYEIYEGLFDQSSFPLSRMTALMKMAKMDATTGAVRSAIDHCEYILDAGGTTFYKGQAQEVLDRCRPKKKAKPQAEELGELEGTKEGPTDGTE